MTWKRFFAGVAVGGLTLGYYNGRRAERWRTAVYEELDRVNRELDESSEVNDIMSRGARNALDNVVTKVTQK